MSEPRKPIFGFLWPAPDPNAPTDGDYRQTRLVRVCPRGIVRIVALLAFTLATIAFVGSAVLAALSTRELLPALVSAAVGATLIVIMLRGWVVGTYVNDEVLRIETTWRRRTIPIGSARGCVEETGAPLLGLPLPTRARRVHVRLADGTSRPTHVYASSPDLWPSGEAYEIARDRLTRWLPA